MRHILITARMLARLAALSALAAAGLTFGDAKPAFAEFEIQESQVEKGEAEAEYRGAVHFGVPKPEGGDEGGGDDDGAEAGGGALESEEEEAGLRQSHDFELQYGVTERIMASVALLTDEPIDGNYDLSAVEFEGQYEFIEREGDGLGLAFQVGYGIATRGGEADEIEFGPLVELASGPLLLTINPFLAAQVGEDRETDGLGFEYGWRAEYEAADRWGVGVEMFGEIEDLSNSGPFDDQAHSIGPTIFYNPGDDDDDVGGEGHEGEEDEIAGEPEMEFSFNVGVQFGLTDAASDSALKFQGSLEF